MEEWALFLLICVGTPVAFNIAFLPRLRNILGSTACTCALLFGVDYARIGYLDPFYSIALFFLALIAFVISTLVIRPTRERLSARLAAKHDAT